MSIYYYFTYQLTACFLLTAWFNCFSINCLVSYRFILGSGVPVFAAGLRPTDTVYNPLPLYHSSAGILCCGPCFYVGLSIALKKKFSAKEYWKDCIKYKATVSTALYLVFQILRAKFYQLSLMTLN